MRALLVAAVALVVVVAASSGAAQSTDEPAVVAPRIRLVVPKPGKVAVEAIRLRVTGQERGRVAPPPFVRVTGLPRGVSALVIRRERHVGATDIYTLAAIVVNRSRGRTLARAAQGPKKPLEFYEEMLWNLAAGKSPGAAKSVTSPVSGAKVEAFAETIPDANLASDAAWAKFKQTAGFATTPGAADLDTGHYDDGHSFGWTKAPDRSPVSAFALLRKLVAAKPVPGAAAAMAKVVGTAPPSSDPPPPLRIRALFVAAERETVYRLVDADLRQFTPPRARSFVWWLHAPKNDRRCNNGWYYSAYGAEFAWYHGDDVCDHSKENARGHRGTVSISYRMLGWYCRAYYFGTVSGVGDPAACNAR